MKWVWAARDMRRSISRRIPAAGTSRSGNGSERPHSTRHSGQFGLCIEGWSRCGIDRKGDRDREPTAALQPAAHPSVGRVCIERTVCWPPAPMRLDAAASGCSSDRPIEPPPAGRPVNSERIAAGSGGVERGAATAPVRSESHAAALRRCSPTEEVASRLIERTGMPIDHEPRKECAERREGSGSNGKCSGDQRRRSADGQSQRTNGGRVHRRSERRISHHSSLSPIASSARRCSRGGRAAHRQWQSRRAAVAARGQPVSQPQRWR